jgi:Skp family chaperone for outer membrane proteins
MKFRSWALAATVILSLSASLAPTARAQAPMQAQPAVGPVAGQPLPGTRIALIDVNKIFQNHLRFKAAMEQMKQDVATAEKQMKDQRDVITRAGEDLQRLAKGSPDYKAAEEDLTRRQTELTLQVQRQKNDFVQREAQIYNNVYQEILARTDYFCRQTGIDMVLRFNGEKVDINQPNSVLSFINRPVVWYSTDLDITGPVLQELNRSPAPPTADRNNAVPGNRQAVPFRQ